MLYPNQKVYSKEIGSVVIIIREATEFNSSSIKTYLSYFYDERDNQTLKYFYIREDDALYGEAYDEYRKEMEIYSFIDSYLELIEQIEKEKEP